MSEIVGSGDDPVGIDATRLQSQLQQACAAAEEVVAAAERQAATCARLLPGNRILAHMVETEQGLRRQIELLRRNRLRRRPEGEGVVFADLPRPLVHEFNNLLTMIAAGFRLLARSDDTVSLALVLQRMDQGARRCAEIARQL